MALEWSLKAWSRNYGLDMQFALNFIDSRRGVCFSMRNDVGRSSDRHSLAQSRGRNGTALLAKRPGRLSQHSLERTTILPRGAMSRCFRNAVLLSDISRRRRALQVLNSSIKVLCRSICKLDIHYDGGAEGLADNGLGHAIHLHIR